MVLTITVNPLLEKRLYFDKTEKGEVNRCYAEKFYAGGKGINVSRQLNKLGIKNQAITFAGGNNGKILRRVLTDEEINFLLVSTKSETRSATLLLEKESPKITSYIGLNSEISDSEVAAFIDKLDKMIQNASVVILTGSLPSENTAEIFTESIKICKKQDKICLVDTYGPHLTECIDLGPFAIHNNIQELEHSFNIDLSSEESKVKLLHEFYSKDMKLAFFTNGKEPVYASKFDFIYKIMTPQIEEKDPLGSGDAFVAGIAHGIERNLVFNEMAQNAISLGAVNAEKWSTSEVTLDEMKKYIDNIEITSIGKKMKLIDDTARY